MRRKGKPWGGIGVALLLGGLVARPAWPANVPPAHISGMGEGGGLALPSPIRVAAGLALTLVLAVGGIIIVKRFQPKGKSSWNGQGVKVLARTTVAPSLRAHVLEVASCRILVVEGRSGIGMTLLPADAREAKESAP
jgi:hypothetical protein